MQTTPQKHEMQTSARHSSRHPYRTFLLMIATSVAAMYCASYLNTYELDHIFFSQTRLYMSVLMGTIMSLIMLGFMSKTMLADSKANLAIAVTTIIVFVAALLLMRSQATVDDVAYMEAMIPHHSIAILTSERAKIRDRRVRALADQIIRSQTQEIAEMKSLIHDIDENRGKTLGTVP